MWTGCSLHDLIQPAFTFMVGVAAAAASDSPQRTQPPLEGKRVLVVEDNPVNQLVCQAMLARFGLIVEIANNGIEGLQALERNRFDLVLMDCQMPEMDGFTATAAIRQQERESADHRHVPIIALTANAMEGDRARCLAAGMDDYLAKPFTMAQLSEMLTQWLRVQTAAQSTEPAPSPAAGPNHTPSDQPPPSPAEIDKTAWDAILALQRPGRPDIHRRVDRARS